MDKFSSISAIKDAIAGETYNPRHHGVHYHVEYRNDPSLSWNNKNNVNKYLSLIHI